jgi:membrane protein insertase Oxa1/YidC/SpoIIIJ
MIRLTLMIVAILTGVAPMAQAVTCSERMADLSKKMEAVTDKTSNKEEAAKHMAMAKEAMAKNDESGCIAHAEAGLSMIHGD